jgi:hypothetical protein
VKSYNEFNKEIQFIINLILKDEIKKKLKNYQSKKKKTIKKRSNLTGKKDEG